MTYFKYMKLPEHYKKDFTLVELIMVISIIIVLASLLLPALRKVKDKSEDIKCKNNMKQLMVCTHSYGEDYKGFLPMPYDTGTGDLWTKAFGGLLDNSYIPKLKNGKPHMIICPSWPYNTYQGDHSICYGMASFFKTSYQNIQLYRITDPSEWPLFADSISSANRLQRYIIRPEWSGEVHLRHFKKSNIGFVDGSARTEGASSLMRFRKSDYYSEKNFFSYPAY